MYYLGPRAQEKDVQYEIGKISMNINSEQPLLRDSVTAGDIAHARTPERQAHRASEGEGQCKWKEGWLGMGWAG